MLVVPSFKRAHGVPDVKGEMGRWALLASEYSSEFGGLYMCEEAILSR